MANQRYITKAELMAHLNNIAPFDLAQSWDNVGILVDTGADSFKKIFIALDATPESTNIAKELGCDLILTHHPLIFCAIKKIDATEVVGKTLFNLIQNNITHIACHTNLDAATGGVNDVLANLLNLQNIKPNGMLRTGTLPEPMTLEEFSKFVKKTLGCEYVLCAGKSLDKVFTVAVCGGSGGSMLDEANGADVLVTGELKYDHGIRCAYQKPYAIAAGHFETEAVVLNSLFEGLQSAFNKVEYNTEFILANTLTSPFFSV